MSSTSGNATYIKSMNGIITLDDGAGTVIEDGTITTDSFSTTNFDATNIVCDSISTGEITSKVLANPINVLTTTTGQINIGGATKLKLGSKISITDNSVAGETASDTVNLFTATTGNIYLGGGGQVRIANSVLVSDKVIVSTASSDTINLFNNISTGTINMAKFAITQNSIASAAISDTVNLFNNLTTGTLNILNGIRTAGSINIATNGSASNTAPVNIGGDNSSAILGIISRIRLNLNGDNLWSNTNSSTSFRSNGSITLASFGSGNINIGNEASTTSNINIGRSANTKTTTISGTNCTINPSGIATINGGTTTITGSPCSLNTSTTGTINIGDQSGTTSGALGNIFIGNDANNLATSNNGICQINKARIGDNGTPYRCCIIERAVGASVGGNSTVSYTIPGAPTTYGNPIVIATINVVSTNMYMVMTSVTGVNTFDYIKRFYNGSSISGATNETFSYVAYWF